MELWSLLSIVALGSTRGRGSFSELVATPVEKQGDERALARFLHADPAVPAAPHQGAGRLRPAAQAGAGARRRADPEAPAGLRHHLQRERQHILGLIGDFDANRVAIFRSLTSCASSVSTRRWSTPSTRRSGRPRSTSWSTTCASSPPRGTGRWSSVSSPASSPAYAAASTPRGSDTPTSTAAPATATPRSRSSVTATRRRS